MLMWVIIFLWTAWIWGTAFVSIGAANGVIGGAMIGMYFQLWCLVAVPLYMLNRMWAHARKDGQKADLKRAEATHQAKEAHA